MTTMLDKMAEALYVADCRFANGLGMQDVAFPPWAAVSYSIRARFHDAARAALQAIRVPDAGMIEAGESAAWDKGNSMPTIRAMPIGYTAMIDAILSESA